MIGQSIMRLPAGGSPGGGIGHPEPGFVAGERVDHFETSRRRKDGKHDRGSQSRSRRSATADGKVIGASKVAPRQSPSRKRKARPASPAPSPPSSTPSDDAIVSKNLKRQSSPVGTPVRSASFGYNRRGSRGGNPVLILVPPNRREEEPRILEAAAARRACRTFRRRCGWRQGRPSNSHVFPHHFRRCGTPRARVIRRLEDIAQRTSRISKRASAEARTNSWKSERERGVFAGRRTANRMKGRVSSAPPSPHELRTPLNAIVGWTPGLEGIPKRHEGGNRARPLRDHRAQRPRPPSPSSSTTCSNLGRIVSGKMTLDVAAARESARSCGERQSRRSSTPPISRRFASRRF